MFRFSFFSIFLLIAAHAFGQSYMGKDSLKHDPRFYFNVGGYFPRVSTELRVDGDRLGSDLSLEDDLRFLKEMSVFRAEALVRVKKRSQFVLGFTSLLRRSTFRLDEEIKFADTSFAVNARADMYFDTYYYAFTWRYSFWNETNWNAGASLGVRMVEFRTGIEASFNNAEPYSAKASLIVPALLLGLHGGAYLDPRLLARYNFEFLRLNVSGIDINIIESQFSLSYFVTQNIGLGLAYSTNSYVVTDIPFDDFKGRVQFEFGGLNLFLNARF
jgi:hypothetical protein